MHAVEVAGTQIGGEAPPRIMGVLNVSEESPYDPSVFTEPDAAAEYVDRELIDEGADIVDIGIESANKRFDVLTAEEERERLDIALETIAAVSGDAIFSIETRYASVATAALDHGFHMVNDICGFADPEMATVAREYDTAIVKMAGPGELERPGALATVDEIYEALAADPLPPNTIIDPAFGGWSEEKTEAVDRETFRRLGEFRALDRPILVSINRKNFLRHLADRSTEDALPVSLAATSLAIERGADVIRTHDVAATRDAAIIGEAFAETRLDDPHLGIRELPVDTPEELRRHLARIGGPKAAAADGEMHALELTGLAEVDASLLAHTVDDCGGTFVRGRDESHLLLATPRQLQTLRGTIGRESDRLAAMFARALDVGP